MIDPTSLEELLVGRWDRAGEHLGCCLIVTYRPEFEPPPWIGQPYVTALTINRLCEREIAALIDGVIGNKTPCPRISDRTLSTAQTASFVQVEEITKSALLKRSAKRGQLKEQLQLSRRPLVRSPQACITASRLMARPDRLGPAGRGGTKSERGYRARVLA